MTRGLRSWLTAAAAATAIILAGCSAAPAEPAEPPHVIYITSSPIGQNPFLLSGKAGIEAVSGANGGTTKVLESKDHETRMLNLRSAVAEAPAVIVMAGYHFDGAVADIAKEYPDQAFLLVDGTADDAPPNLHQVSFREQEAGYLLGVEAGLYTDTDVVGAVIANEAPVFEKYLAGFEAGARSVNRDISFAPPEMLEGDVPLDDAEPARQAAARLAEQGADHIFAIGAGARTGVLEAAEHDDLGVLGVDAISCGTPEHVMVDSAVKSVDRVVEHVVTRILSGESIGEDELSFGIAEGGVAVASLVEHTDGAAPGCTVLEDERTLDQVSQLSDAIAAGRLDIPNGSPTEL